MVMNDRLLMVMVMVMIMMVRTLLVVIVVMVTSNKSLHLLSTTSLNILWAFRERIRSFIYDAVSDLMHN